MSMWKGEPTMAEELTDEVERLLPLAKECSTAKQLGALVIEYASTGTKRRRALALRDALGRDWKDSTVIYWTSPRYHTEEHADRQREIRRKATAAWLADPANVERKRETTAAWLSVPENRERQRETSAAWYANPVNRERMKKCQNRRYAEDPAFVLRHAVSSRINCALRSAVVGTRKCDGTLDLLGCSAQYYKAYLEGLFEDGMTWDNWSPEGWHIDHVVPVASFDLTGEEGQRAAFHFTNTRPMWADENRSKGSTYDGRRWTHSDHAG